MLSTTHQGVPWCLPLQTPPYGSGTLLVPLSRQLSKWVWQKGIPSRVMCGVVLQAHGGAVTGISLHPTGDYLLSSSLDQHWAFSDIRNGVVVAKGTDSASPVGLTSSQFHPDGLIFGTGTEDSVIKIWDLKESTNVANFPGHSGAVTCISFSENGFVLFKMWSGFVSECTVVLP